MFTQVREPRQICQIAEQNIHPSGSLSQSYDHMVMKMYCYSFEINFIIIRFIYPHFRKTYIFHQTIWYPTLGRDTLTQNNTILY